jgi:hypothetical protein
VPSFHREKRREEEWGMYLKREEKRKREMGKKIKRYKIIK